MVTMTHYGLLTINPSLLRMTAVRKDLNELRENLTREPLLSLSRAEGRGAGWNDGTREMGWLLNGDLTVTICFYYSSYLLVNKDSN